MSLKNIEQEICANKIKFPFKSANKILLEIKKEQGEKKYNSILHEYDLHSFKCGNKNVIQVNLENDHLSEVGLIADNICKDNLKLKPDYTFAGKAGEIIFAIVVNRFFKVFSLQKELVLNENSFVYGGDGGGDFFIGNRVIDVKYRDETPSHGMILDSDFLDRTDDSTIFVHTTNVSTKIGNMAVYKNSEQVLPLAVSGWTTADFFKKNSKKMNGILNKYTLDNLFSIKSLLLDIVEYQIEFEKMTL